MNSHENAMTAIEFRESDEFGPHVMLFGSATFLLFWVALFAVIVHGQKDSFLLLLVFAGIGLVLQQAAKWFASGATQYQLFPDKLLINGVELPLDEIAGIKWPVKTEGEKSLAVQFAFQKCNSENGGADGYEFMDLFSIAINKLERDDRLLLVRYLQQHDCVQENWPEFCCLYLNRWLTSNSNPKAWDHLNEKFKTSPFWSGFIYTPYVATLCVLSVSKYVYWLVGVTLAISTVINIRLLHGTWFSPIGEMMLAIAAVVFCLGFVAALFPKLQQRNEISLSQKVASHQAAILFIVAFVLGPLVVQLLLTNGWEILGQFLFQLLPFTPTVPLFAERIRDQKDRRDNPQKYLSEATRQWENYCESTLGEDAPISDRSQCLGLKSFVHRDVGNVAFVEDFAMGFKAESFVELGDR